MRRLLFPVLPLFLFGLSACQTAAPAGQPAAAADESAADTSLPAVSSASLPIVFPKIDRHPGPWDSLRGTLTELPVYDPDSDEQWQMDLRSYDVSGLDFRNSLEDLLFASFDEKTVWPPAEKMPAGFDWQAILEKGKNPGLGMRSLHAEGITGNGVGIAIIDQTLLVDHREYGGRIRLYEELEDVSNGGLLTSAHGPAVASIAAGKNVGVAPGADLFYIATNICYDPQLDTVDFSCLARGVRRIIEIDRQLPGGEKIRVLSMSIGWRPESKGYDEIQSAVQDARDAGIFIICSSEQDLYGFQFHGLGRRPLADPDAFESYEPGSWWAEDFYRDPPLADTLLIPMDSRATASPTGADEYVFYREGGWSWSIPYIAGTYALAAQVRPDVTPELFWSTALRTGRTIEIAHEGRRYSFGVILDPAALIHALQAQ